MMKKISLALLCSCIVFGVFAQKKTPEKAIEKQPIQHEIGLNVTNLLTDLLGNNNRSETGNYLLSYKRVSGDRGLRVGATINFALKKEDAFVSTAQLINQNFQLRVGYEKRYTLSPKLQYYIGIDALSGYKQEQSNSTTATLNVIQTDLNFNVGIGPVLGFQYAIYDRLLVGTEGSFYASYFESSTKFKNFGSSAVFPSKQATGFVSQTNLPKFLFLIVKFN